MIMVGRRIMAIENAKGNKLNGIAIQYLDLLVDRCYVEEFCDIRANLAPVVFLSV